MPPVEEAHLVVDDVEKRPYGLYGEVLEASRLVLLLVLLWRVSWDPQTLLTRLKGGAAQRGLRWRLEIGRKTRFKTASFDAV
jgi:hypothetical protein